MRTAWCFTCEAELSPGARGTGCPRSSSLAGPGPSAVAGLPAALPTWPASLSQNYVMEVEFILRCNQDGAVCAPAESWQQGPLCCGQLLV